MPNLKMTLGPVSAPRSKNHWPR